MTSRPRVHSEGTRMPAMEVASSGLKHCQQAQDQLEEAISGVMKAEQQLRENAREVRLELQSCVSRQQEALRCREVWLLGQIELLEQVKTETLQQQLHQLHWLRGQFDAIAQQLQNSKSTNDLNNQLTSCMEKLCSLSLTPEETPDMSFHADTRSLRQAITSFGSVTAQFMEGVSAQSPTHQRGQVQSCRVTSINQIEVGALDEWLLGSHPTSNSPIGYQSSKNPQDWLMPQKESKTSCPVLASMDFLRAWDQLRDPEVWLLQDQTLVSRERTGSSSSSSFSIEKIDESEFTLSPEEEGELSDWLITPPTVAMEIMSNAEQWQQVLKPFEDSWSTSDWLLESSRPVGDCSSCCQTSRAVEIENLGQLKCLKTPPFSNPTSSDPTTPPMAPETLEAWLQQAVPVKQTCRANELCSTYSDCVCEDNCGREALSLWLLQQEGRDKNGVPVAKDPPPITKDALPTLYHIEQEQKVQAILQAWLHPRTPLQTLTSSPSVWVAPEEEKATREEHSSQFKPLSSLTPFQSPLDPDLWVLPKKTPAPGSHQSSPAEEEDKWLLKKSQAQEHLVLPSICDLFSCMKVGGDKEKWLYTPPVRM